MKALKKLAAAVTWHRRALAVVFAVLATLSLAVYLKEPPPNQEAALMVTTTVPAGSPIPRDALKLVDIDQELVTDSAVRGLDQAVGQQTLVTLEPGTVLQEQFLLIEYEAKDGYSLVPISVPDSQLQALLSPGTLVTLVLAHVDGAEIITNQAVVSATAPAEPNTSLSPSIGREALILVEVPSPVASQVAVLGQQGALAVILGGER